MDNKNKYSDADDCRDIVNEMKTTNLAIIITGQIRTFFNNTDFEKLILLSQKKYNKIMVVSILNFDDYYHYKDKLEQLFEKIGCLYQFYNWETDIDEFNHTISEKLSNSKYIELKRNYFSTFKQSHIGLNDPDNYIKTCSGIQQFQLKKGIQVLTKYISENNIDFEICMRTRFDSKYPDNFFPHFPESPLSEHYISKLAFDHNNCQIMLEAMKQENVCTFQELIEFNKTHRLHIPNSHIPNRTHSAIAFGGMLCHNYESLQRIFDHIQNNKTDPVTELPSQLVVAGYQERKPPDQSEKILYAFNDYYFFSKKEEFVKLQNWFDDSNICDCNNPDLYNHFFSPETQLLIFCVNNDINILMYPHWFYNDNLINR